MKVWRLAHAAQVEADNAARRLSYAVAPEVVRARANLRSAIKVGRRVESAQHALDVALAQASKEAA